MRKVYIRLALGIILSSVAIANDLSNEFSTTFACPLKSNQYFDCKVYFSQMAEKLYGITDFTALAGDSLLEPKDVSHFLMPPTNMTNTPPGWILLGNANMQQNLDSAQALANRGHPVVVFLSGYSYYHAAYIVPGELFPSASWAKNVPNAAVFDFKGRRSFRNFFGKPLSFAFGGDLQDYMFIVYHTAHR
jgi:hypothetical protein